MTELKTLKDISWRDIEGVTQDWVVTHEALKVEAIKWVKTAELIKQGEITNATDEVKKILTPEKDRICEHLIFLFKYFFNITEEDLK